MQDPYCLILKCFTGKLMADFCIEFTVSAGAFTHQFIYFVFLGNRRATCNTDPITMYHYSFASNCLHIWMEASLCSSCFSAADCNQHNISKENGKRCSERKQKGSGRRREGGCHWSCYQQLNRQQINLVPRLMCTHAMYYNRQ